MVGNRPEAVREPLRIRFPGACLPPALPKWIPARVNPPVVRLESPVQEAVGECLLVFLVRILRFIELSISARSHLGRRQFSIRPGHVMGAHPSPPDVLCTAPIPAPPKLHHNQRAPPYL